MAVEAAVVILVCIYTMPCLLLLLSLIAVVPLVFDSVWWVAAIVMGVTVLMKEVAMVILVAEEVVRVLRWVLVKVMGCNGGDSKGKGNEGGCCGIKGDDCCAGSRDDGGG